MDTKVYACYLRDNEELGKSSSGGAFTALSNVLVHTGLGAWIFREAVSNLNVLESTMKQCMQPGFQHPCEKIKRYKDIHRYYENHGLEYIIEKYVHFGPGNALMRRLRRKFLRIKYEED